jgi:hypothetical protein
MSELSAASLRPELTLSPAAEFSFFCGGSRPRLQFFSAGETPATTVYFTSTVIGRRWLIM